MGTSKFITSQTLSIFKPLAATSVVTSTLTPHSLKLFKVNILLF
ncbi:MAG: hypothetical protein WCG25_07060 [bacterium]